MCIKETLRLYPLTIMTGKLSSEDVVADGYKVPKGMYVKCDWLWENPPVMHKDNYLEKRN